MFNRRKLQFFTLLFGIAALTVLSPATAFGAGPGGHVSGMILVLNGIKGESKDAVYKDGIDVSSMQFGASNTVSTGGTGGGTGKASFSELTLTKLLDSASLPMLKNLAEGRPIKDGTLYFFDSSHDQPYLKIEMKNIFVIAQGMSSGSDRPSESVSLKYMQALFTYNIFGLDGRITGTQTFNIDVAKNEFS